MPDVFFTGSPNDVIRVVSNLGRYLSGDIEDKSGMVRDALVAVGLVTLTNLHNHFDKLSRGGTGDDGTIWKELSAVTLALRMKDTSVKAIERMVNELTGKTGKASSSRRRLFLSQAKKMRAFYERGANRAARRRAMKILELTRPYISETRYNKTRAELEGIGKKKVKRSAVNRLIFASASALILRNNNDLFNSFEPYLGAIGQVFTVGPGWVDVGTAKDYAKYHQSPEPRKLKANGEPILPRRPIIPDEIPQFWYDDANEALQRILGSPEWMVRFLKGNAG